MKKQAERLISKKEQTMNKTSQKRRFGILFAAVGMICCFLAAALLAACNNQPAAQSGDEVGVYYYDDTDRNTQSLITLGQGCSFTLALDDEAISGTYSLDGETLTLTQTDSKTLTATLRNDVITLTYENVQMRFLKKLYFTVTFDTTGGSEVEAVSVLNGKAVSKPVSDPTREGYVFLGWYTDAQFTSPYLFGAQPVTGDLTLYARWAQTTPGEAEYTISYDLGYDGEEIADSQTIGGKLYLPATPAAREGYRFVGWWVSMENDRERLSYRYEEPSSTAEGTLFNADTTLFAVWQAEDAEYATPAVSVSQQAISWESVGSAAYLISVTAPDGTALYTNQRTTSTTFPIAFDESGAYRVEVTAVNAGGSAVSDPAVRYYVNHALARVSDLRVIEPSVLVFSGVENAQKYLITIDCGDKAHTHTAFDNGTSLYYNFSNCEMQPGGIRFTVEAVADGYASSKATFVFERNLASAENLTVTDDVLTWDSVPGATSYDVQIGDDIYTVFKPSFSLKTLTAGSYAISVTPVAKGFNSPAAAQLSFDKTTPALPADLSLKDMTFSWTQAEADANYFLVVNGNEIAVDAGTTSYDLTDLFTWADGTDYSLQLKVAKGDASALSDVFTFRYNALDPTVVYDGGILSWKPVAGAQKYEIRMNGDDSSIISVENGIAKYELPSLAKEGLNTIEVRFTSEGYTSEWASVSVYAHAVIFDSRGGSAVETVYKAVGDRVVLPKPTAKTGYEFVAWYSTPNGPESNGAAYTDEFFVSAGELVLYAYYEPKAYTIHYSGADGLTTDTVRYGEDFTLAVPQSDDATRAFGGWYSSPYGAGIAYTDAYGNSVAPWDIAEDGITVYAFWVDAVLTYTAVGNGYAVSAGARINLVASVTVPSTYNGAKVTQIAGSAFANCASLKEINLPDTIEQIATATAFTGCTALEAVNVYSAGATTPRYTSQDGVLFDSGSADAPHAMRPAYIPSAKTGTYRIPDGVDIIPRAAFTGSMIEKVIIPASVTAIEAEAFADCAYLSSVVFEQPGLGKPSLTIGERAFKNCELLTSISLPARLQNISLQKYVQRNSSFESLDELTEDAPDAFLGCTALERIDVAYNASAVYTANDGVLFTDSGRTLVYFPAAKSASDYVFPTTVRSVAAGAFLGCSLSGALNISAGITSIGDFAFAGTAISEVSFASDGVGLSAVTVGAYAFYGCEDIEILTFADESNVTELGTGAFKDCEKLPEVIIPASMKTVGDEAFANCGTYDDSFTVTIAQGTNQLTFGNGVFSGCTIDTLSIPSNVTLSADFLSGLEIENIFIAKDHPTLASEDNVLYIKDADGKKETLLLYLSDVADFTVPNDVKSIAANAFYGKFSLTNISLPESVTAIGENAFYMCSYLASVTFRGTSDQPLTIGDYAFWSTGLHTLTLPDRPITIGAYAFAEISYYSYETYDDESLAALDLGGTVSIGDYAFYKTGEALELTIPATVKTIGNHAFEGSDYTRYLTSVTFEEGSALETIGAYAFSKAKISSFRVPASVTLIGAYAFSDCNDLTSLTFEEGTAPLTFGTTYGNDTGNVLNETLVTEIHFPGRLTVIGESAFDRNSKIETVTFGDQYTDSGFTKSNLTTIGEGAFRYASALSAITIPASVKNTDVIAIGNEAFLESGLTSVTFEESDEGVLTIGTSAFSGCKSLLSMNLPKRLGDFTSGSTTIPALANGTGVFPTADDDGNGFNSVSITEGNALYASKDGILYTSDFKELVYCPPAKEGTVEVDARTERIGTNAFANCKKLTAITFPADSVCKQIGAGAFSGCSLLVNMELPDSVAAIGEGAFLNCNELVSLRLPASLSSFDPAMLGCKKLTDLTVSENNPNFSSVDGVLFSKDKTTLVYYLPTREDAEYTVPDGTKEIADKAFSENVSLTKVTLPASLERVGANAFSNCMSLETVSFAAESKQLVIDDRAFNNTAVSSVSLPAGVSALGDEVFTNSALAEIEFAANSSLTALGNNVFSNTDLVNVTLPAGLRVLGNSVFRNCTLLESAVLPEGLTTMGDATFYGCSALTSVSLPSTLHTMGTETFYGCSSLTRITFAANSQIEALSYDTFSGCTSLEEIELPASLTEIAGKDTENSSSYGLFQNMTSLKRVTFAEGSKCLVIGASAFEGSSLESFTIPSSVTTIGSRAFASTKLTQISIPRTVTRMDNYAFSSCTLLEEVRIEAGLVAIPEYAFQNNTALVSVNIPATVTSVAATAFNGCTALKSINLDSANTALTVEDGVLYNAAKTEILFMPAAIESFRIPAELTTSNLPAILSGAAGLEEITVEEGNPVYRASGGALYDMNWNLLLIPAAMTEFVIPKEVTSLTVRDANENTLFYGKAIKTITYEDGRTQGLQIQSGAMGQGVFVGLSALESVVLPDDTVIGAYAFFHCAKLTSVTFGAGTGTIGANAFAGTGIKNLVLTEGFTSIGKEAFLSCTALAAVTFPASLTSIDATAFNGCTALAEIKLNEGSNSFALENGVLYNKDKTEIILMSTTLTSFELPASFTTDAFLQALKANTGLQSVTVAQGNTAYQAAFGALYDMKWNLVFVPTGMTTFKIPKDVTHLGPDGLFSGTAVETVTFEDGGTQPLELVGYNGGFSGASVFQGASKLTTVNLPARASIGEYAFFSMSSLTSVTLSEGITSIGYRAFNSCTKIERLVIPASAKVDRQAFRYWTSSQTLVVPFAEGDDPVNNGMGWNSSWKMGCSAKIEYTAATTEP